TLHQLASLPHDGYQQIASPYYGEFHPLHIRKCYHEDGFALMFSKHTPIYHDCTAFLKGTQMILMVQPLSLTTSLLSVEDAGADGISAINSLLGMKIDIDKRKPVLANNTGGLSGPAVRPVAVRMVYQIAQAVKIPILGL